MSRCLLLFLAFNLGCGLPPPLKAQAPARTTAAADAAVAWSPAEANPPTDPKSVQDLELIFYRAMWRKQCGITKAYEAYCWGPGILGDGKAKGEGEAGRVAKVKAPVKFSQVWPAFYHTCALGLDHRVWCWGEAKGTVGIETKEEQLLPVPLNIPGKVIQITAGRGQTCALNGEGHVYCWGFGFDGALGMGDDEKRILPTRVPGIDKITAISTFVRTTCAVSADQGGYCWGGFLPNRPTLRFPGKKNLVKIEPTLDQARLCALDALGDVYCHLGSGKDDSPIEQRAIGDVVELMGGRYTTCALKRGGDTYCWGLGGVIFKRPNRRFFYYNERGDDGIHINEYEPQRSVAVPRLSHLGYFRDTDGRAPCGLRYETGKLFCWGSWRTPEDTPKRFATIEAQQEGGAR